MQAFLLSDRVKAALNEEGSALTAISVLKKICDHPALLTKETAALAASAGTRGARKARLQLKGANAGSDDGSDSEYSDGDGDAGHASTRRILGTDGKHLVQDWGDPDAAANLLADLDKKCITASCKTVRYCARAVPAHRAVGERSLWRRSTVQRQHHATRRS